ncbi:hypothetical protein [Subtercola sp. YIM 133946]
MGRNVEFFWHGVIMISIVSTVAIAASVLGRRSWLRKDGHDGV